jgi:hypothetical protein
MSVDLILSLLVFANTIVIIAVLVVIIFVLIRMSVETAKFVGIDSSFSELTRVVEQQSRLLEFIGRRSSGG